MVFAFYMCMKFIVNTFLRQKTPCSFEKRVFIDEDYFKVESFKTFNENCLKMLRQLLQQRVLYRN